MVYFRNKLRLFRQSFSEISGVVTDNFVAWMTGFVYFV